MNETFNPKRFIMLFKKYTIEHFKANLLSTAVLSGLLFLLLGFYAYNGHGHLDNIAQTVAFIFFLLLGGSIFTSLTFLELGDAKKSIPVLTLPASAFEKFLVAWLYSYVIFQLIFIADFYLMASVVIHLGASASGNGDVINVFSTGEKTYMAFPVYALFHGFAFWGAIHFEKLHFIKTSFVFFIALIVATLVNNQLIKLLIGDKFESVPFQGMGFEINHHYWHLFPAEGITQYSWYILGFIVLLLWVCTFTSLKEKEV